MRFRKIRVLGIIAGATLGACATTPHYISTPMASEGPVEATTQPRFPVSRYSIPEDSPEGTIQITSFGVVPLTPTSGEESSALHVRVILANKSGHAPWRIDTRKLLVTLYGEGESRPAFVNTDAGTPPHIEVPPGEGRTLDLFYPLPGDLAGTRDVSSFSLRWTVVTDRGAIVRRTPLEEEAVAVEAAPSPGYSEETYPSAPAYDYGYGAEYGHDYGYDYGYGYGSYAAPYLTLGFGTYPYWYYDPFFPTYTFFSVPPIVHHHRELVHAPRPVTIARPPSEVMRVGGSSAPVHIGRPSMIAPRSIAPRSVAPHSIGAPPMGSRPEPGPGPSHIGRPPGPSAPPAMSHPAPAPPPMHAPMPAPSHAPMPSAPSPSPPVHIGRPPH